MWTIPLFLMKVPNSSVVKFGALFETKISGNPSCANADNVVESHNPL